MSDARKRAEEALAKWDSPVARQLHEKHSDAVDCVLALRSLLAALDADKRLEKAEAALREIADTDCGTEQAALVAGREDTRTCAEKAPEYPDIWCGFCIARRYFARRDKLEVPE